MEENNRIEKLLAMQLINSLAGKNMAEKAAQLSIVGFTNVEIANLLETNSGTINQLLYARRKKQKSKGKK
jgi:DNA-directed RNA polymerase specialized sigma24 family protein